MNNRIVNLLNQDDANVNLFFFPFAGGTSQSYRQLIKSGEIMGCNIFAFELPGRGIRISETFNSNLNAIKEDCLTSIMPYLNKKMILLGHSMGAIIAFELLSVLETHSPNLQSSLIVSAANSPRRIKFKHDV